MVAGSTPAPALFEQVCEELGKLLAVKTTDMIRFEHERFAMVVGSWMGTTRRRSRWASASPSRVRR